MCHTQSLNRPDWPNYTVQCMEEGCRKPVLGVCSRVTHSHADRGTETVQNTVHISSRPCWCHEGASGHLIPEVFVTMVNWRPRSANLFTLKMPDETRGQVRVGFYDNFSLPIRGEDCTARDNEGRQSDCLCLGTTLAPAVKRPARRRGAGGSNPAAPVAPLAAKQGPTMAAAWKGQRHVIVTVRAQ